MTENILNSITEQYHTLTRSSKKLADYIFAHTSDSQYLSITTLAENSGVSEATITRFCRGLGLSGYNDFKLALAKSQRTTDLGESSHSPESITTEDDCTSMCKKIHNSLIQSVSETYALLDQTALQKAIDLLSDARHVYCFGQGGSSIMAMEAWGRFSTTTSNFIHISDSHMQAMAASLSTTEDVILFFSYSGSTKDMEDILKIAKENKTPVILITHFSKCRGADYADVILLCGYNESPLQSGSVAAKVGQMYLIECLFYGYSQKQPVLRAASRAITAEVIAKKLL